MPVRHVLVVIALFALLLSLIFWRLRGPDPLPVTAPADQFSSVRAAAVLAELLREGRPHPLGSPLNQTVRARIEARLRSQGYTTEVQRDFVCNATPSCAPVENVLAYPPAHPGPWILLLAHYDSVGAGPGASDDGAGTAAVLEVARALGKPSNVAFLITDGEEAGLLGAEAFVKSPWRDRVAAVINVEYRGTSGPSFLFETSRGNAGLMPVVRSLARPAASSLFYTIYEMLPNDTDVTVFKRAGITALNFGAIGDVAIYHTPLDDVAHVNLRTLQHQGENLLASVRAMQRGFDRTEENAAFFDVLNLFVVWWPESWTLWIAIGSMLMMLAGMRQASWPAAAFGALLSVLAIVIAAILGIGSAFVAHTHAGTASWLATPHPVVLAMWLSGIAATLLAFSIARTSDRRGLFLGAGLVWNAGAIAASLMLPGTAFLVLIPAIAFAFCAVLRVPPLTAALVTSMAAAIVLLPLAIFLYPALGRISLAGIAVIVALVSTTIAPWIEGRRFRMGGGMAVLAIGVAAAALAFPAYTKEKPRRRSIDHELSTPTVRTTARREGALVTLRVASARDAERLMVQFKDELTVVRVNGVPPAPRSPGRVWRGGVTVYAREAVIEVRGRAGIEFTATDLTYGLPDEARQAAAKRDAENAVPSHRGDVTISSVKGTLP
jgi:acetylornithine deacetylase/succinyl-diaminopimelate desuccinylase-like protein